MASLMKCHTLMAYALYAQAVNIRLSHRLKNQPLSDDRYVDIKIITETQ